MSYILKRFLDEVRIYGWVSAARAGAFMFLSRIDNSGILRLSVFGSRFVVRKNSVKLGVGGLIYARRNGFESELQQHFSIQKPGVFLDVGANYGFWSRYVINDSKRNGLKCEVVALEPLQENATVFKRNFQEEINSGDVSLLEIAASDFEGVVHLCETNQDPGSTHIDNTTSGVGSPVVVNTIDNIVAGLHGRSVCIRLVKVDVEGFELGVLKGAINVLKDYSPRIICEIISAYLLRANASQEELFDFMDGLSYQGFRVMPDGGLDSCRGYTGDGNYVFERQQGLQ